MSTLAEFPPPPRGKTGWPWTIAKPVSAPAQPDGRPWPRISIVTPSYNQAPFIEETIRSVLLQGYPDLEYIIIDGGSKDGSVDIIRKYENSLTYWVSEHDRGQSHAINKGFQRTSGEILGWVNSDDFLAPGALMRIAERFAAAEPGIAAIVGIGHKIDANYTSCYAPLPARVSLETLFQWCDGDNNFMQPACFFTSEAFDKVGPLREDLHYCMDLALWLAIAQHYKFQIVNEDIAYIHTHPSAKTIAQRPLMFGETALLFANTPGGFEAGRNLLFRLLAEQESGKTPLSAMRLVKEALRRLRAAGLMRSS